MTKQRLLAHTIIFGLFAVLFLHPVVALGEGSFGGGGGTGGGFGVSFPNPIKKASINEILTAILDFLTAIGAVLAVLFTVYAGFLFVTARGNESQLEKAKQTLFWTLVGAVIVLGAFALAKVIENTANELKG